MIANNQIPCKEFLRTKGQNTLFKIQWHSKDLENTSGFLTQKNVKKRINDGDATFLKILQLLSVALQFLLLSLTA